MKRRLLIAIALVFLAGCRHQQPGESAAATNAVVSGGFSNDELRRFAALNPIDTHTHIYQTAPAFVAMLDKLHLHVLDIVDAHNGNQKDLDIENQQAWAFVNGSGGHASLCATFNPFPYREPGFAGKANVGLDRDFAKGAVAVKIWKNIGEQVKDATGNYVLPDDPAYEPIYRNIAAHHKTLIAHVADPNTIWEAPNTSAPDYAYYMSHPEWYMYNKLNAPSKPAILRARDHLLEMNPNLRVVGAHLGSMEADFNQLVEHLDRYPNFAVDIAARMPYFVMKPRTDIVAFIEKYQDRLIYGTDFELKPDADAEKAARQWEEGYALDWRFLATDDVIQYGGHTVRGLSLPERILRKLYHDNAVKWFPGMLAETK